MDVSRPGVGAPLAATAVRPHGWLLPGNPPEFGGRNAGILQQFVHREELSRRRIYHCFNSQGVGIIATSLLSFGTEEQKRNWAVPILRAEMTASLGMSEPGAGSDLAGLTTRAVLDNDHFVVNGQKVWTSGAHEADVVLTFVRTDPDAPRHKGISALLIRTDAPGVICRPFASVHDRHSLDFNEVFFTDVRVPAENLVGPLLSTGSVYGYQGQRPLRETDPPGVPLRANYSFSKAAAEAVCTWVSDRYKIPLTVIRICSTYGPEGGAPADRLEMILAHKPIRLHPDKPNNYNPIYEDDYVELGIRAMEVADTPPVVVNWAGSETVSIEDYCRYMGELVGVEPMFEYTPDAHTPLWPDVTRMHEVLGGRKCRGATASGG